MRNLVRTILERSGYTVTEADSGEEAVKLCGTRHEGFDLLVTDVVLTGMRGREVASSVRRSPTQLLTHMKKVLEAS